MSLMKTHPTWYKGEVVATERGWVAVKNNEVLVAIGNLKDKLLIEQDQVTQNTIGTPVVFSDTVTPVETIVIEPNEVIMESVKEKKTYAPRKPKVIGEVTEVTIEPNQRIIGEVVEYNLEDNNKVISE